MSTTTALDGYQYACIAHTAGMQGGVAQRVAGTSPTAPPPSPTRRSSATSLSRSGLSPTSTIQLTESLRSGAQGTVWLGALDGQEVAVKLMPPTQKRSWHAEKAAYSRLSGREGDGQFHIITPHAFDTLGDGNLIAVLEAAASDMCDIAKWAQEGHRGRFGLGECTFLREACLQTSFALHHAHCLGVAHRDVKPDNLIVCKLPDPPSSTVPPQGSGPTILAASSGSLEDGDEAGSSPVNAGRAAARAELKQAVRTLWIPPPPSPAGGAPAEVLPFCVPTKAQVTTVHPPNTAATAVCHGFITKLCDFGAVSMSRRAEEGVGVAPLKGMSARGTAKYASPQIMSLVAVHDSPSTARTLWPSQAERQAISHTPYDAYACDAWSFAVTVCVLVTGKVPFAQASPACAAFRSFVRATQPHVLGDPVMAPNARVWEHDAAKAAGVVKLSSPGSVESPSSVKAWKWPCPISPALEDLLLRCMRVRDEERPQFAQIKTHPWFCNPAWEPEAQFLPQTTVAAAAAGGSALGAAISTPRPRVDTGSVVSGGSRRSVETDMLLPSIRSSAHTVQSAPPPMDAAHGMREITPSRVTSGPGDGRDISVDGGHALSRRRRRSASHRRATADGAELAAAADAARASGRLPPLSPAGAVTVGHGAGLGAASPLAVGGSPRASPTAPVMLPFTDVAM